MGVIETLQNEGKTQTIRLFQSQLDSQEHRYEEARRELDEAKAGSLSLTEIALCSMEVV